MHEHLKTLSARHLATIATRLAIVAFSLRVAWLLVLNMGVTLAIFGPVLTVIVLSVLGMVLWFSVERIGNYSEPYSRVKAPKGGCVPCRLEPSSTSRTPTLSLPI